MDIHSLIATWQARYQKLTLRQKKIFGIIASLMFILLLMLGKYYLTDKQEQHSSHSPQLIRVGKLIKIPPNSPLRTQMQVHAVRTSDMSHVVALPGVVESEPHRNMAILPPLTGLLLSLPIQLGEEVKKGQLLAVIQSANMAQAYADKLKAKSALKQASEAWIRARKVNRVGANAIKELEQIHNNYRQAQAEMQRAKATLSALGQHQNKKDHLQIHAPIDGKITSLSYGPGAYINDPSAPILNLSNINEVWVTLCIPEHMISWIKEGQKAKIQVDAYPQRIWDGTISFTNNIIDPDTRCNKSRIALSNPDVSLQPNMFATVYTEVPQKEQIIIPLSAVFMNDDTTAVFVEVKPWIFTARPVILGPEDGEQARISSGLKAGERIVIAGGILIND
jgi:membrane fusion protein, heavy metal efflux system